jgi:lysophospholipase L1-like esterase
MGEERSWQSRETRVPERSDKHSVAQGSSAVVHGHRGGDLGLSAPRAARPFGQDDPGGDMYSLLWRVWRREVGWSRLTISALIALVMIASGTAVAAAAPLPHRGSVEHSPSGNGTIAAKSGPGMRASVRHAATSAPTDATGALSTVSSVTVHGGYTAAGIGMRNLGYGKISITGVPTGATVQSATLLWDILAGQADLTFAHGTFNGNPVTGTEWASGASPCWSVSSNFSYEADVTSLVTGNGSYTLAGFATGKSDGADPWNVGSTPPLLEGASLVVVYTLPSMPETTIQIAEGATETDSGNTASATLSGFTASAQPPATTTYIVADGQAVGNTASFNGTTLPNVSFPGADPQAVPNYSLGNLWDTVTTDVSSLVNAGDKSATLAVTGYNDCLVWVGQVLAVSGGSGGVYAFGDSIAAGYGMPGLSDGTSNDNPFAYPALLSQHLGLPYRNFASAGACADATDAVDPFSLKIGYCNTASRGQIPLSDQIAKAPPTPMPSLVTLTIGANDIDFENCIQSVVLGTYNDPQQDPCEPKTNLPRNLQAFGTSLKSDLTALQKMYPHVPILITGLYNPFPSGSEALCNFDAAVGTWLYIKYYLDHDPNGLLPAIKRAFIRPDAFVAGLQDVQGAIYNRAAYVLNHLDATSKAVASSLPGVSFAPLNFGGHDFCQAQNAWIFGPDISASLSLHLGGVISSLSYHSNPLVCPNPTSLEQSYGVNPSLPLPGKNSATFSLNLSTNCMPHPTQTGQEQLANQIYPVAKQLLS